MESSSNGKKGPWISHLMFVDNLLLNGETKENQKMCIMDILKKLAKCQAMK